MQQAVFFHKGTEDKVVCDLCPHQCTIGAGKRGVCGVRLNYKGQLLADSYGKITALHTDPIEKKPLYHYFPGSRILSVGSYGCNLSCNFCQNYHISQTGFYESLPYSVHDPEELEEIAASDESNVGIAYTYNEPGIWYEYVMETAQLVRKKNMKNVIVSNGFLNPEPLKNLLDYIDAFNIDLKAFDSDFYRNIAGAALKPVLDNIITIAGSGAHLEITHLVIPGLNDDPGRFSEMVKWIAEETGPYTPLHISRYFPSHKLDNEPTPVETIFEFCEIAKEHLAFVYPGNVHVWGGISDTICPSCHATVMERGGYTTGLKNASPRGKCSKCGFQIFKMN